MAPAFSPCIDAGKSASNEATTTGASIDTPGSATSPFSRSSTGCSARSNGSSATGTTCAKQDGFRIHPSAVARSEHRKKKPKRYNFRPIRSGNPPPRWSPEAPHRKAIGFLLLERQSITSVRPISFRRTIHLGAAAILEIASRNRKGGLSNQHRLGIASNSTLPPPDGFSKPILGSAGTAPQ